MNGSVSNDKGKQRMIVAFKELKDAWANAVDSCDRYYPASADYIIDGYPFGQSFDEIEVSTWIDGILDKLQQTEPQK